MIRKLFADKEIKLLSNNPYCEDRIFKDNHVYG